MNRPAALLAVLVAATGLVAAFVGPCDAPPAPTETPHAASTDSTAADPPATAPVATPPTRGRKRAPTAGASETSEPRDDDADTFALRIRVVDERSKAPIAGAEITRGERRVVTGVDGEATFTGLPGGADDTAVRARGFICKTYRPPVPCENPPDVVELASGVVVPIEVVDAATGRPVPAANVRIELDARRGLYEVLVTDDAARAEAYLPPGVTVAATTRARGHVLASDVIRTEAIDAPQPTLRVTLAPAGVLRGIVRGPDGAPVEGATVHVRHADADNEIDGPETGADGAYEVDGLVIGATFLAHAEVPTGGPAGTCESAEAAVAIGRDGAVLDLRLRKEGGLDVTVVDDDGAVVDRLDMALSGPGTESSSSGTDGKIEASLAPGRYVLKVWKEDCVPVADTFDVAEGATSKRRIVLTSGESISGVVVDEAGAPVEEAAISAVAHPIDDRASTPWTRTDAEGRFTARRYAKGVHDVRVSPPFEFEEIVVHGVAAPSEHQRFVVARRGTLALHVTFEDDARPRPNARIAFRVERDGEPWTIDRPLPGDGRFEIPWPVGVRGAAAVVVDGFLPATRNVAVPAGAAIDLGEIRLRRGVSLAGVLCDPDGKPAVGRGLSVHCAWHDWYRQTDESGRFTFDGLAPGSVRIDGSPLGAWSLRVDVPTREPVVLTVPRQGRLRIVLVDGASVPVMGRPLVIRDADGGTFGDLATDMYGEWDGPLFPGKYAVEIDHGPRVEVEVRAGELTFVKLR